MSKIIPGFSLLGVLLVLFTTIVSADTRAKENTPWLKTIEIEWHEWSEATFEKAANEGKLVLLDVSAEWCQFCKKMEQVTYQDPVVISIISEHYIPIKADIEKTEAVRLLYENFGVPGTIVLTPEKVEINKRRGYIEPQYMQWHLLGVLQDV